MTARVVVLGGGISSLSFAYYLKQRMPKCAIQILESQNTVGGWLKTYQAHSKTIVELGPRTMRLSGRKPGKRGCDPTGLNLRLLLHELGLQNHMLPLQHLTGKKFLFDHDSQKVVEARNMLYQSAINAQADYLVNGLKIYANAKHLFDGGNINATVRQNSLKDLGHAIVPKSADAAEVATKALSAMPRGIFAGRYESISADAVLGDWVESVPGGGLDERHAEMKARWSEIESELDKQMQEAGPLDMAQNLMKDGKVMGELMENPTKAMGPNMLGVMEAKFRAPMILKESKQDIAQFHGGMQTMVSAMQSNIDAHDTCEILTDTRVCGIKFNPDKVVVKTETETYEADAVFSGLPSPALARLLLPVEGSAGALGRALSKIDYVPVVCVTLGWEKSAELPQHLQSSFGHLIPVNDQNKTPEVLGIIYDSEITKYRARRFHPRKDGKYCQLTVMLGGAYWNEQTMCSKSDILGSVGEVSQSHPAYSNCLNLALSACEQQLGYLFSAHAPDLVKVDVLDEAIPQYYVGHRELVAGMNDIIKSDHMMQDRFFLGGNAFYGVGVPSTIVASRYVADNVADALKSRFGD